MKLTICTDQNDTKVKAGNALTSFFSAYPQKSVLFMTAGGSSLSVLDHIDIRFLPTSMTISVLDERFSPDESINNFSQLSKTKFYNDVYKKNISFIDTRQKLGQTHTQHAARFEKELKKWHAQNLEGFVVSLMGIGPDGHIAGVMPDSNKQDFKQQFIDTDKWVISYDIGHKNKYPLRTTTTLQFIQEYVDCAFVYAVGKEKHDALCDIFSQTGDLYRTPARILRTMKSVEVFSDQNM